ncbi:hypothetical protein [Leifsonia shinshuensis]|uniref:hypothetical protein n=1 Tax=Leifsonia shinshuensis TaxID=150026 RepID=UPI00285A304F|nr:hypothetical protein [Leifsonia shinshuensis]MDR6971407.1 hypothetical protein [Leifsonia shinshuensis]
MTPFGGTDPGSFLRELKDRLERDVQTGAEGVQDWIEAQVHGAAVGLLHSLLPSLVRANMAAVKVSESATLLPAAATIDAALATADLSNTALAGAVADTVQSGIRDLRSAKDYTRGVNSIAW